ncbi:four helix bundle protein [Chlorobaculum limnaeum]|uniref:four helix bundle protein n=1 Tax=Chlorobaculum limnaeum TaxID=274537 RepID=UPI000AD8C8D2|nr:four helix bundle protein [Chlorobaculum limnaeum]
MNPESQLPEHGGYRELKSFQVARLVYDLTVRFCNRYIENNGRIHFRMVQAARSGVQNIVKGSQAGATSKTTELSLNSAARTSLIELRLDYENFLRQNNLQVWPSDDRRRKSLISRKCSAVDEVVLWVLQEHKRQATRQPSSASSLPEIIANAAITLINLAGSPLRPANRRSRQTHRGNMD